ncbi:MAG: hemerythrin family protein [Deltaproteobacteria bacterium]|nr:hemerythrin family protein [Deltaproteobacteria bacterium]
MDDYVIAWSERLATHNAHVDEQHKTIIERIGRLRDFASDDDLRLFDELFAYAQQHFADEENYMAVIGYPNAKAHQAAHKTLIRTLAAYRRRYEQGDHDLYALKHFAFRWMRDHIMDEDRQVAEFARSLPSKDAG